VRFRVLACDFDGTIATEGVVSPDTLMALERVRRSGRRLLMVTGRTGLQLEMVFGRWDVFDRVVLENGAVMLDPSSGGERLLCAPVSRRLEPELHRRGVEPLAVGRAIYAASVRHLQVIRQTIQELDLPLDVVVNRGGVVILPEGVSKSSGTAAALLDVGEPAAACVAVGDAENDVPMLALAGCGVAVANALDQVKAVADLVTRGTSGDGVVELIGGLLADDLAGALAGAGGTGAARRSEGASSPPAGGGFKRSGLARRGPVTGGA
jgi:hydroxymethylpyrimidine pyrophosphatase-like HAD family hydrolase